MSGEPPTRRLPTENQLMNMAPTQQKQGREIQELREEVDQLHDQGDQLKEEVDQLQEQVRQLQEQVRQQAAMIQHLLLQNHMLTWQTFGSRP